MPGRSYSVYLNRVEKEIQFDHFTFLPESGELTFLKGPGESPAVHRLAPQPSRLLALLIERYPDMVSHEEIKQEVWPDVEVDFERSLHFCIRQIRAALEDNANEPTYIQTIPRRGYRWLAKPDRKEKSLERGFRIDRRSMVLMLSLLILVVLSWLFFGKKSPSTNAINPVLRIAVLPFQTDDSLLAGWSSSIAMGLVETLTNQTGSNHQVIGPTTTISYLPDHLPELIQDYAIDYVINGRFLTRNDTNGVLAEVIRATDGAHVWVRFFTPATTPDDVIVQVQTGLPPP